MDNLMSKMLVGKELEDALTVLPVYDDKIRYADAATRLTALSDLYSLYIPSKMSTEIYSKLYLALLSSKNGRNLVGMLTTQLINCSGISICMVGTPECIPFFEQATHLARRATGLLYNTPPFDKSFADFCKSVFGYQYTRNRTEITPAILNFVRNRIVGIVRAHGNVSIHLSLSSFVQHDLSRFFLNRIENRERI